MKDIFVVVNFLSTPYPSMCCIISGEPIEDSRGRIKTYQGPNVFQTPMLYAPCAGGCGTFCWFLGQFIPATCGLTQCLLRRKVLNYDMTKYSCFQGYFDLCCCIKAGACGEENCPDLCLCCEACVCNFAAISASRMYVMEKYDLASDPCDYRLIRLNNCLQALACFFDILAIFIAELREFARILDHIASLMYHCVSGCMTAQTAFEVDYQNSIGNNGVAAHVNNPAVMAQPVDEYGQKHY